MECGATKNGVDWISDFSIKVQENSSYKVEFEDHKFVFSILNSVPTSAPLAWIGVSGPASRLSVQGERAVSLTLEKPLLYIECRLVTDN
jgi:hypothetical protein